MHSSSDSGKKARKTQSKIPWKLSFSVHTDQPTDLKRQINALYYDQYQSYYVYNIHYEWSIHHPLRNESFLRQIIAGLL